MHGYPICPIPSLHDDEEKLSDLQENLQNNNPDLIMVQMDPMTYLNKARSFALNNLPLLREQIDRTKKGIFGNEAYKLPFEAKTGMNES